MGPIGIGQSAAATPPQAPASPSGHTTHRALTGINGFKRCNPRSDLFHVKKFDHVEFWCGDALNTSKRYAQCCFVWFICEYFCHLCVFVQIWVCVGYESSC
jgi:hypothetical protein